MSSVVEAPPISSVGTLGSVGSALGAGGSSPPGPPGAGAPPGAGGKAPPAVGSTPTPPTGGRATPGGLPSGGALGLDTSFCTPFNPGSENIVCSTTKIPRPFQVLFAQNKANTAAHRSYTPKRTIKTKESIQSLFRVLPKPAFNWVLFLVS